MKSKETRSSSEQLTKTVSTDSFEKETGAPERRPRTLTPVAAGSAAEVRPDTEKLVNHAASLYGSYVGLDNSRLSFNSPFCPFERTGLAERIRGVVANGHFNGLAYWDSGWTPAGGGLLLDKLMAIDPGRDAEVRIEITAKHTELNQVAAGRGSSAGMAGGALNSGQSTGTSTSVAPVGELGFGSSTDQSVGTTTSGSTGLTMDLPAKAYVAALVFDVKVSFKPFLGPPVTKQGPVVAGELMIKSAMALPVAP